jgi:hypothetical protein
MNRLLLDPESNDPGREELEYLGRDADLDGIRYKPEFEEEKGS